MTDLTPDSGAVRLYAAYHDEADRDWLLDVARTSPAELDRIHRLHVTLERLCSERIAAAEKAARVKALEEALSAANVEMEDWRIHGFSHETLGAKSVRDRIRAIIAAAEAQPGTEPDHG